MYVHMKYQPSSQARDFFGYMKENSCNRKWRGPWSEATSLLLHGWSVAGGGYCTCSRWENMALVLQES